MTKSQAKYWDGVANAKTFSHPVRLDWLREYLKTEACILDYGCGYGRTLAELSRAGYTSIVGMDFSERMLTRCRVDVSTARLIRNDGVGIPLQSESVDAVLLFAVLTCIPDSGEQRALLVEVNRVLRDGGLIYISDLLINADKRNQERYQQYAGKYDCYGVFELPEGVVVRHHTSDWITELTRPFVQLESDTFNVTTMNGNASAAFQYLGRKE